MIAGIKDRLIALIASEATHEVSCEPETDDPITHFGYDTDDENRAAADYVRALADRSEWGWCVACVRVTWRGMTRREYLGGCSYESREQFERDNLDQMRAEAIDALADDILTTHAKYTGIVAEVAL